MSRQGRMKIGYLSGSVDARQVYESWKSGNPLSYFGSSYLLQFYAIAASLDVDLVVVTSHEQAHYDNVCPGVRIMNRSRRQRTGICHHLGELAWLWRRVREIVDAGARIIVLTDAALYWWALLPWRMRGVRFVNALHCTVLRPAARDSVARRVLVWLTSRFHYRFADPSLAASPLIVAQLGALSSGRIAAVLFLPTYAHAQFADILPPRLTPTTTPTDDFHILFAGRIERNKGVFDLLEVCGIVTAQSTRRIVFHVCGEGTASAELATATRRAGLEDVFLLHGFCNRDALTDHLSRSDAVIVPTRSDFEEGFAMIVAEGIMARRPVITSRVCPSLELVRDAAIEVEPDDIAGYAAAVLELATDRILYTHKVRATEQLRAPFFDETHSYGVKLRDILAKMIR